MVCVAPSTVVTVVYGLQVLNDALRAQQKSAHDAGGKQNVQRAASQIHPEIADGLRFLARKAADHGDGDGEPGGGRDEVLHGEAGHLNQVAHGRFAAVALPVRVRHEADRRVEGAVGRHHGGAEVLRVKRQVRLHALQHVQHHKSEDAEAEHGGGVLRPALLHVLAHTGRSVREHFQPAKNGMQKGALSVEDVRHERAQRLRARQQRGEKDCDLQNSGSGHRIILLEPLRFEQRVNEIHEQRRAR